MKSNKLIMLTWLVCGYGAVKMAHAQQQPKKGEFIFQIEETDKKTLIRSPASYSIIEDDLYQIPYHNSKQTQIYFKEKNTTLITNMGLSKDEAFSSPIMLGIKINNQKGATTSVPVKSISRSYISYLIQDSASTEIVAMGINQKNVGNYRYHVVENDSVEIVPWTKVPLQKNYGALAPYGFIGKYLSPGKQILVEVQNIKDYSIRDGILIDWRVKFKPLVTQITISLETNKPFGDAFNLSNTKANRGYATNFENGIPTDLSFPADSVSTIRFDFKHHETLPYVVRLVHYKYETHEADDDQIGYYILTDHFDVDSRYFKTPGDYEIVIQSTISGKNEDVISIPFKVKPPPLGQKKVSLKQLIPYAIATLLGFAIVFFIYRRQSRAKLLRIERDKEMVGLKLRSVRAQLNPHFMFNALTSIQNLINKNNISGANYYLSKFAGLTRQVLDGSNDEMISLADELQMLDDYLQMEQLRFNFKYTITTDEQLDTDNIEIPAMLLQPFIENAIKHGITTLDAEGKINVSIKKEQNDLVLSVTDNGVGFVPAGDFQGYGIKLSEDRVALLNQNYPGQLITLHIAAQTPGTQVTIRLSNWIA